MRTPARTEDQLLSSQYFFAPLSCQFHKRLDALRAHLAEGAGQAARKDFVEGFDIESVIERTKTRA